MESGDTAVIVFHGMGQQVPFETLANVVIKTAEKQHWIKNDSARDLESSIVPNLGSGGSISRVRLHLSPKDGNGPSSSVDFYECYWAPFTQGKAGMIDIQIFLLRSIWAGIKHSLRGGFDRYFWRGKRRFPLSKGNLIALGMATLFLLSFVTIEIFLLSFLAAHTNWKALSDLFPMDFIKARYNKTLFLLPVLLLPFLAFVWRKAKGTERFVAFVLLTLAFFHIAAFWGSTLWQWSFPGWSKIGFVRIFGATGTQAIFLAFASLVAMACTAAVFKTRGTPTRLIWTQVLMIAAAVVIEITLLLRFLWPNWQGWETFFTMALQIGYGMVALALFIIARKFLIYYIGPLAVYASVHTASKFAESRARIQEECFKAACHAYASGYRKIIMIGHSLGSVIAYDILNSVINYDFIQRKGWRAAERTKLLLTFGSPLNKIAFIFRDMVKENPIREFLVASKQPLLEENHAYRPAHWVNVWSRNDVFSGALEYFDMGEIRPVPGQVGPDRYTFTYSRAPRSGGNTLSVSGRADLPDPGRPKLSPVIPIIDPRADIPLAAHTQYWENDLIYRVLVRAIEDEGDGHFEEFIHVDPA